MILIVSEHSDESTNCVIDWLAYNKQDYLRFNREDFLKISRPSFKIQISNQVQVLTANEVNFFDRIKAIWYRRPMFPFLGHNLVLGEARSVDSDRTGGSFYYEYLHSCSTLYSLLEPGKKVLGNFRLVRLNKLEVLLEAKRKGFDIPETIITNRKTDVIDFLKSKRSIITKTISEVFDIRIEREDQVDVFINYTEEITEELLDQMPETFYYSLFQEKLDKEIEIRTFFLNGECYSMAIFSQKNFGTSVDFRKYANNRCVPYQLPIDLHNKINFLMTAIGTNTASLDFVRTKDGRYVFLEVNPTGQYGMTSDPCNYHLDKKIAEYLMECD